MNAIFIACFSRVIFLVFFSRVWVSVGIYVHSHIDEMPKELFQNASVLQVTPPARSVNTKQTPLAVTCKTSMMVTRKRRGVHGNPEQFIYFLSISIALNKNLYLDPSFFCSP